MVPSASALRPSRRAWLYVIAVFVLLLHMPSFGIMGTREAMHFTQALRWMEPDRFGQWSATWENPPVWLAFNAVAGPMITQLSDANAQRAGRILGAVVNGVALAALAVALGVTVVELLAALPFFILALQEILGQEWLYVSFEPKVLAYPFVVLALERLIRGRPGQAGASLAVGAAFHPVVGLQWLILLGLFQGWERRSWREPLRIAGAFAVLFVPYVLLVLGPWLREVAGQAGMLGPDGRTAAWIYTYLIDPSHVAPFKDLGELSRWDQGIGLCLGMFAAAAGLLRTSVGPTRTLARICVVILGWLVLALALSLLDRVALGGVLGPWQLFRPSSLGLLLFLFTLGGYLRDQCGDTGRRLLLGAAILVLPIFVPHIAQDWLEPIKDQRKAEIRQAGVRAFLSDRIPHTATLLLSPSLDDEWLDLERTTGRPTLVNRRFTPVAPVDILEWRARKVWREDLFETACPALAKGVYPVDYLLLPKETCDWSRFDACADRAFEDAELVVYRVRK